MATCPSRSRCRARKSDQYCCFSFRRIPPLLGHVPAHKILPAHLGWIAPSSLPFPLRNIHHQSERPSTFCKESHVNNVTPSPGKRRSSNKVSNIIISSMVSITITITINITVFPFTRSPPSFPIILPSHHPITSIITKTFAVSCIPFLYYLLSSSCGHEVSGSRFISAIPVPPTSE